MTGERCRAEQCESYGAAAMDGQYNGEEMRGAQE